MPLLIKVADKITKIDLNKAEIFIACQLVSIILTDNRNNISVSFTYLIFTLKLRDKVYPKISRRYNLSLSLKHI